MIFDYFLYCVAPHGYLTSMDRYDKVTLLVKTNVLDLCFELQMYKPDINQSHLHTGIVERPTCIRDQLSVEIKSNCKPSLLMEATKW